MRARWSIRGLVWSIAIASAPATLAAITPGPMHSKASRPASQPIRLGVVLSGGGARGIAHIGVLTALEEHNIPIHFIAGTSMGAVIGSLYASGYDSQQLRAIVGSVDWRAIFGGRGDRRLTPLAQRLRDRPSIVKIGYEFWSVSLPRSALSDYWVQRLLVEHLTEPNFRAGRDFDSLPIPFRCVATNLRDGSRVVLRDGNLALAVRASMSIPVAFAPIALGDKLLVDGGLVDNLPVGVAKDMGAEKILAIDISSPALEADEYEDVIGIASQMTDVLMRERNKEFQMKADVEIRPDLGDHGFSNYSDFDQLIQRAYDATMDKIEAIQSLGPFVEKQNPPVDPSRELSLRRIERIEIEDNTHVRTRLIRRELQMEEGEAWNLPKVLLGFDRVFASGLVDGLYADVFDVSDEALMLQLRVDEAPRRTVDLSLAYNDEDKTGISVSFNNKNLFGFGEQARIDFSASDRNQSAGIGVWGQRFSGVPFAYDLRAEIIEDQPRYFEASEFINRAEFDRNRLSLDGLFPLGRRNLARAGVRVERVTHRARPGIPFPEATIRQTIARLGLLSDTLDDQHSPRDGRHVELLIERNIREDEGLSRYWRGELSIQLARSLGKRQSLALHAFAGLTEGPLPLSELFRLGGPSTIPGLSREELWGPNSLFASISHRLFLSETLSLNSRLGIGNVFFERNAITLGELAAGVGFGAQYDSPVGPITVDFGVHESGNTRLYLSAGFPMRRPY